MPLLTALICPASASRRAATPPKAAVHTTPALLKLYLWGYLKRTRSSRGLESACAENLQAIWLTRNLRPDHSAISLFRKNHPDALKAILREFNLICFPIPRHSTAIYRFSFELVTGCAGGGGRK